MARWFLHEAFCQQFGWNGRIFIGLHQCARTIQKDGPHYEKTFSSVQTAPRENIFSVCRLHKQVVFSLTRKSVFSDAKRTFSTGKKSTWSNAMRDTQNTLFSTPLIPIFLKKSLLAKPQSKNGFLHVEKPFSVRKKTVFLCAGCTAGNVFPVYGMHKQKPFC